MIKCPAKINLFLHIVGKREDGYHLLESVFTPLRGLADTITLASHDLIECNWMEGNTAVKAAQLIKEKFKVKEGVNIQLAKNIPMSSGCGGSSTDAGTLIPALIKFWNLTASQDDLIEIALKIGADVPYFLDPKPAFVSGIGEFITPIKLGINLHVGMVFPEYEISSKDNYNLGFNPYSSCITVNNETLIEAIYKGKNDMTQNAIKLKNETAELLSSIKKRKGCLNSSLNGSGSSCFGLFESQADALSALNYYRPNFITHYEHIIL